MGSVGGLLGLNGGAGGTGFSGPQAANITDPVTQSQINASNTSTQNSLTGQQNLLGALQKQNGLGNENQVYGQLQGVANGTGPNPAQAMLNQQTGANVANQAALMAGQRGAGANVGLLARQAAQQGASTQQQSVGQGATMQANQSLNALNSAGAMANTQAQNQISQTNANTLAQQQQQQMLLNAQQGFNASQVSSQSSVNAGNTALANTTLGGQQSMIGGGLSGAGKALAAAEGGDVASLPQLGMPQSSFGKFLMGMQPQDDQSQQNSLYKGSSALGEQVGQGIGSLFKPSAQSVAGGPMDAGAVASGTMSAAKGGQVPVLLSPGEKKLSPQAVEEVKRGASPMAVGKTVPGKPKVGGAKNSYSNDFVKDEAEPGTIIVPRSETKSKNPDKKSAEFVAKVLAKRRVK